MSMTSQKYAALANDVYYLPKETGRNTKATYIGGVYYRHLEYVDCASGYQGILYQRMDTGEFIVAHRGTESEHQMMMDGLFTDGGMVFTRHNAQAADAIAFTQHALEYAKNIAEDGKAPSVTVTGHSLGGNLAQVTAHYFDLHGETFNAYGAVSLDRRIPEGGNTVINHVIAGDPVSAASQHYGQVRVYARTTDVATLQQAGYVDHPHGLHTHNPLSAAEQLMTTAHGIHNFLPVDAMGRHAHSVLQDASAQDLARQHEPMISHYRHDVATLRAGLTLGARGVQGAMNDAVDVLRGAEAPGVGRRAMDVPTWPEQMQHLHTKHEHGTAIQGAWQVPLQVPDHEPMPTMATSPQPQAAMHAQQQSAGPFNDPYLDRMYAALQAGDNDALDRIAVEFSQSPEGQRMIQLGDELYAQQQQLEQQMARSQQRPSLGR
ncbi:DUF6792 domain-containing protein [Xanthomonas sp. MUS 060]|uniref:DUF6792 domain-containing protein n=1 Tax=Xanthomonas sp. MUS 060 TaxID=1588031 RepID=UPI0005F28356|nr:DUF6792 domain-containing protein [Xanthomonas sp. MUS 060]